jgi:hypothetical protein
MWSVARGCELQEVLVVLALVREGVAEVSVGRAVRCGRGRALGSG